MVSSIGSKMKFALARIGNANTNKTTILLKSILLFLSKDNRFAMKMFPNKTIKPLQIVKNFLLMQSDYV